MRNTAKVAFDGNSRFQVRRPLGSGAFGSVYEVFDKHYNTVVALKLLNELRPSVLYRFKQEFRLLADRAHPNLVTLYELHSEGEQWFFTMEYVEGSHFGDYVRGTGLSGPSTDKYPVPAETSSLAPDEPTVTMRKVEADSETTTYYPSDKSTEAFSFRNKEQALRAFSGNLERLRSAFFHLAQGVQALHTAGIVHRDLKPSNVIITPSGRVVVLDFGLAKELLPVPSEATPDEFAGSPPYMAPEQWAGEQTSAASDWYSVGVMLFEVLVGRRPFNGPSDARLAQQRQGPIDPSSLVEGIPTELAALCLRLLHPDPRQRAGYEDLMACVAPGRGEFLRQGSIVPMGPAQVLVGREQELGVLTQALQRSSAGTLTLVNLRGEPGMGKSTLLRSFVDSLYSRGVAALLGRCYERESVPYKALDSLMDALGRYLLLLPRSQARELITPELQSLTRLFPVLRLNEELLPNTLRPAEPSSQLQGRQQAVAALRELLRHISQRTSVVLCLDDLQWGDVDSARFLAELLSNDAPPLLLVASYRAGEEKRSPFLLELERLLGGATWKMARYELEVGALSPDTAVRLAMHHLGASSPEARQKAEKIAAESRGNPLFIEELSRTPTSLADSPEGSSLREVLGRRVRQLPDEARHLLELLAVAGRPTGQDLLFDAAESQHALLSTVVLLRAHNLLRIRSGERAILELSHDRIREGVVGQLEASKLAAHHGRLAHALETRPGSDPELLAIHHHGAGNLRSAALHAFRAAERANQALAFNHAAELFGSAIEWSGGSPAPELGTLRSLKLHRAEALANAGRGAEAAVLFLELAQTGGEPREMLELQRRAIENYMLSGRIDEGQSLLQPMLSQVPLTYGKSSAGALAHLMWQLLRLQVRGMEPGKSRGALSPEQVLRIDLGWSLGKALASVDWIRAAGFQLQSLRLALDSGEPSRIARSLIAFGPIQIWEGKPDSVRKGVRYLEQGAALARQLQHPALIGFAEVYQAAHSLVLGDWGGGMAHVDTGMRLLRQHGVDVIWETNVGRLLECQLLDLQRRMAELSQRAAEWHRVAAELGDSYSSVMASFFISHCLLAHDEPEAALQRIYEAMAGWSRLGAIQQGYTSLRECQVDLYRGRPGDTWKRLEELWPALEKGHMMRAQISRMDFHALRAQSALGLAAEEPGRKRELLTRVEKDAAMLEREMRRDAQPLARLLRAGVAHQRGQTDETLALLSAAIEGYRSAGMSTHEACALLWKGELVGGDEGRALVLTASAELEKEGIKRPRQWAAMLAPSLSR
ncbi:protein kinase [Archangium minus]|uniref:non-specific serine/threonine protein kinase n=1 Tax=Archangium minus TaxID=83450 RepID=A0ABY9X1W5_9BACT|nr:protein kinase [Archangium minus]